MQNRLSKILVSIERMQKALTDKFCESLLTITV